MVRGLVLLMALGPGCVEAESEAPPPPPPVTARFVTDAFLHDCVWEMEEWIGVSALQLTLEYRAEGELPEQVLPEPGVCVSGLELFAEESLPGGDDIPGLAGSPRYAAPDGRGGLTKLVTGLYYRDVFNGPDQCGTLPDVMGEGIVLTDAGELGEIAAAPHGAVASATVDGTLFRERDAPVAVGDVLELEWKSLGWDSTFVMVRRSHAGDVRQTITCGVDPAAQSFTVDAAVWDLVDSSRMADEVDVLLGFENREERAIMAGTARAEVATRAMQVLAPR